MKRLLLFFGLAAAPLSAQAGGALLLDLSPGSAIQEVGASAIVGGNSAGVIVGLEAARSNSLHATGVLAGMGVAAFPSSHLGLAASVHLGALSHAGLAIGFKADVYFGADMLLFSAGLHTLNAPGVNDVSFNVGLHFPFQ